MSGWNSMLRAAARKNNGVPAWVPIVDDDPDFRCLFVTDDARPPDAERGHDAWERIFGEKFDISLTKGVWNGGDCEAYLFPGNRVYEVSFDGATIWQWCPPRKFD